MTAMVKVTKVTVAASVAVSAVMAEARAAKLTAAPWWHGWLSLALGHWVGSARARARVARA